MSWLPFIFFAYASIYIIFQSILLIRLFFYYKPVAHFSKAEKPLVSILIAARNEEENIIACLQAISRLHYPAGRIQVLVGDDQSSDNTYTLVNAYIQDKPGFELVSIQESTSKAKGKANVLAQLAAKATGEFLFITDADIQVPLYWIEGLLGAFEERTGIVSGATVVKGQKIFDRIQRVDWAYAFGMVHIVSEMNIPVSAVGNNMAIRTCCYEETGGYENLEFSVTEDLELFKAALAKGWAFRNLLDESSTAVSAPLHTLGSVLKQRKRWLSGAMRLPVVLLTFLAMQAVYFAVLVLAFVYLPWPWVLMCWLTILNLQAMFIQGVAQKTGIRHVRKDLYLFELNRYFFPLLLFTYQLLPLGVQWKGRTYKGKDIQPS
ncbi:MAG: glycosyltransferase [Cytophaga sp.]|uniref:glycosyltransferase n=1 Tax=Cytophaga sp. TaxID=29535 RepID=UPI003F7EC35C